MFKNPLGVALVLNFCEIIGRSFSAPFYLLGFPIGYINSKVIIKEESKKAKLLIYVSLVFLTLLFIYSILIKK